MRRLYKGLKEKSLPAQKRHGECQRCGACCMLGWRCPFLSTDFTGHPKCLIYTWRFPSCRSFPMEETDLRDRDLIMAERPCGYTFE